MNNFYHDVVAPSAKKYEYLFTVSSTEELNEWFIERLSYEKSQGWSKLTIELLLVAIKLRKDQYTTSFFIEDYASPPPVLESLVLRKHDVASNGITVWHALAMSGNYSRLFEAIEKEFCDPNQQDARGYNVWDYLALSGNKEAIKAVVKSKVIISDNFLPCLMRSGNWEAIEYAIQKWTLDLNAKNKYGRALCHDLSASGNYSALTNGLKLKLFDPHTAIDDYGWTVWHYFVMHGGSVNDIEHAIKYKWCDPTIKNQEGLSVWDNFINNLNSSFAVEAIRTGKFKVSINQLGNLCVADLIPYLITNASKQIIKSNSVKTLFSRLGTTISEFMSTALQTLQDDAPYPSLIFPSKVPFEIQLEVASLIEQIYSLDKTNKLSNSYSKLMLFIAGLDDLSAVDLLVKIPALQYIPATDMQMVLKTALEVEHLEVINRLLLAIPRFRKVAVGNPEFLRVSKESELLLDIASIEHGGNGNTNASVKYYPAQRELFFKLFHGLIPLLRERSEENYDPKVLDTFLKHQGFCFTLSFTFLYVYDHSLKVQAKDDTDNIKYFEIMLNLLAKTDFLELRRKHKLTMEEQTLIKDLDRFVQILLFYQATDLEKLSNGNVVNHTNHQEPFIFYQFSDTKGAKIKGVSTETSNTFMKMMDEYVNSYGNYSLPRTDFFSIMQVYRDGYEIKITDIRRSNLDNFLISYCGHAIAVKRDPENSDVFIIYDSSYRRRYKKQNGNPTKIKGKYLNGYLKLIFSSHNDPPTLDIHVTAFNFDRRSQLNRVSHKL